MTEHGFGMHVPCFRTPAPKREKKVNREETLIKGLSVKSFEYTVTNLGGCSFQVLE